MASADRASLNWLARAGYAARGVVFVILACFTAIAALDARRPPVDSKDALAALLTQPLGNVLQFIITLGLLCLALWREAQCFLDVDRCGSDPKGLVRRAVYGAAGLFYAAFALISVSMIVGTHVGRTERTVHDWTALLLHQPFGQAAVGVIGCAIIIAGLCIAIAGIRAKFEDRIALQGAQRRWVVILGAAGYLTRAVVIVIIGLFLLFAALDSNAHEATGLAGALTIIKRQAYGSALLSAAAFGFLAFGIFGIAEALFRRVDGRGSAFGRPSWGGA